MLIRGDARQIPLTEASVDCVVTSPPYWGLRDYGTARWDGGDPICQHVGIVGRSVSGGPGKQWTNEGSNRVDAGDCHCGARRVDSQLGLEATPALYVASMVAVFREVWRVLKPTGTAWLNLGDSYASNGPGSWGSSDKSTLTTGSRSGAWAPGKTIGITPRRDSGLKPKDLVGIPWRVAFALQADGWYLRSDIIWSKPNPMPESVTDRPTKAHEYLFLLAKQERYYYDAQAIKENAVEGLDLGLLRGVGAGRDDGVAWHAPSILKRQQLGIDSRCAGNGYRNKRSVWTVTTEPYSGAHFATFPEALVEPCILAGCPLGGLVLDPFCGSGTVLVVAERYGRHSVGVDLAYQSLAAERTAQRGLRFDEPTEADPQQESLWS